MHDDDDLLGIDLGLFRSMLSLFGGVLMDAERVTKWTDGTAVVRSLEREAR